MKVKHELNKRQEKRTWFGKLEIMKMSAVWLVITLSVTAMLFIASRLSAKAVENQRKITEKTIRCVGLAEEIQSGSDILTNAVWRFAATGKTRYAREQMQAQIKLFRLRQIWIVLLNQPEFICIDDLLLPQVREIRPSGAFIHQRGQHCQRLKDTVYNPVFTYTLPESL